MIYQTRNWAIDVAASFPLAMLCLFCLAVLPGGGGPWGQFTGGWVAGVTATWIVGVALQALLIVLMSWRMRIEPIHLTIAGGGVYSPIVGNLSAFPLVAMWSVVFIALASTAAILSTMFGLWSIDHPAATAAWVMIFQAVWVALPLPHSMGRIGWLALMVLKHQDDRLVATVAMRRCVMRMAYLVFLIGVIVVNLDQSRRDPVDAISGMMFLTRLFGVIVISMLLFLSSRWSDIPSNIQTLFVTHPEPRMPRPSKIAAWRERRRIKKMLRNEELEATDAARADAILKKLHRDGIESLSRSERNVLRRVSEAIREQRDRNPPL